MSERDATGRFEIERSFSKWWLTDRARSGGSNIRRAEGEALRDLLLRTFPLKAEPPPEPRPDEPELDDDEVRRVLNVTHRKLREVETLEAAARAYLRMREQQCTDPLHTCCHVYGCLKPAAIAYCEGCVPVVGAQQPAPAPTIAQVVEACVFGERSLTVEPYGRRWRASVTRPGVTGSGCAEGLLVVGGDTPEDAVRALYDLAVQRLTQQRDEADEKLRKLGGGK